MDILITFRNIDSTEAIKNHVHTKLDKLRRYFEKVAELHVILDVEKFRHSCEINLVAADFKAQALEVQEDLYVAIDHAAHKLERQVVKHKEKVKSHKELPIHTTAAIAEEKFENDLS